MLRKLIKSIIPNKGDIFYDLFEDGAINAHEAAKLLVEILKNTNNNDPQQLFANSKSLKQKSNAINKRVLHALNYMFITPIDRGDIQELANLLNKLTKRIVKISIKLKIYNIDAHADDCLIKNANTLVDITRYLVDSTKGLKSSDADKIRYACEKINELEENGIEDFRFAMNEMYSGRFDTFMIMKLEEIYKSIDVAIESSVAASDLLLQVSVKSI